MRALAFAVLLLLPACGPQPADDANRVAAPEAAAPAPIPSNAAEPAPAGALPPANQAEPRIAAAIPAAFQGTYDESREACGRPSEYRLRVSADALRFHESIGTVRGVAAEGPGRISVVADYQGEGESWSNTRQLQLSDDGATLTITGEGTSLTRVRCP